LGGISEILVSHFSLRERSLSAYMEYTRNIKLCNVKLGLRYENMDKKYRSNGELLEDQSGNSSWLALMYLFTERQESFPPPSHTLTTYTVRHTHLLAALCRIRTDIHCQQAPPLWFPGLNTP